MHTFIYNNTGLVVFILLVVALLFFSPAACTLIIKMVRCDFRTHTMELLKTLFPYDNHVFTTGHDKLKTRNNPAGYYRVSRPRNFRVLGEDIKRYKFIDFNRQFNRTGFNRVSE